MTAAAGRRRRRQAPRVWWATAWMGAAHWPLIGPWATRLAAIGSPPYYGRVWLAGLRPRGYRSPSARIAHREFVAGRRCFIGDRVLIFQDEAGGLGAGVRLGDRVHIHQDVVLQCGRGARIDIGTDVHIQPRCLLAAYDQGHLVIGERVEIAANCGFFTYNHQLVPGIPIQRQPTATKGGIVVEDDAWIGFGAVVLDGVRIGRGAVVGAGAVVARDIPSNAIAAGVPARVIGSRLPLAGAESARVGERH